MTPLPLRPDSRVLVLTGAGISAESGVPTFRGAGGLWEGHPVTEVASPEGFDADPALVWRFYGERRQARKTVAPNPGHRALVALEHALGDRFLLATQNVDGLHREAGSQRVLAIHGELFESKCERCRVPFPDERTYLGEPVPVCPTCGQRIRVNVVWFGEMLDPKHLRQIDRFIAEAGNRLVFLAVGTSGLVYPAAGLVDSAKQVGGTTVLVDLAPNREHARRFDRVEVGKSGEVLPRLLAAAQ
ncbi:MAG: NAD-dependent deacylase [Myxococcaceae bacterium]|nr:NAD-dependent deacylase [Myxococcaceae bacterium]